AAGGRFLLRLEDIDAARCRAQYEDAICEDLAWLGLHWESLYGARARILTPIAPRWRNSTGWACSIRASKAAARSRECSRSAASGRATLTARRSILDMRMRSRRQNAAPAWPRANPMPC